MPLHQKLEKALPVDSSMEGLTQINPDSIATADAGGIDAEGSVFIYAGLYTVCHTWVR